MQFCASKRRINRSNPMANPTAGVGFPPIFSTKLSYLPPAQIDIRPDSVGKAMPNCETKIVDEKGNPVEQGQIGELVIEGPNVMLGYWKDAEEYTIKSGPITLSSKCPIVVVIPKLVK